VTLPAESPPASVAGRRPRLWPSIAMLVAGVAVGVTGVVLFVVVGLDGILGASAHPAPATVAVHCQVGDYYVYQRVGTARSGTGLPVSSPGRVTISHVSVTGPSGARVNVWVGDGSETITVGPTSYENAVGFHAVVPGVYRVRVAGVIPTSIVVAPSVGSQFLRAAPWLGLAGAGGLLAVGGAVWLIVALVHRRRVGRIDPWGGPPPPIPPGAVPPGPWLPRNYDPFPAPSAGPAPPPPT